MIKAIKRLFNNKIIRNENGSTLTMVIVVIAVLSFTVTTVTAETINLSSSTTANLEVTNDESVGKGLITQSIYELEEYITNGNSYDDFNNNEIGRIYTDYSVIAEDVTDLFPEFGDLNGKTTKVYKFSYLLLNGTFLTKYAYLSTAGTSVDTPHPWQFSMGTNGDLVLNGGYYEDIDIFGHSIYINKTAPWYEDDVMFEHFVTPSSSSVYPDFKQGNDEVDVWVTDEYKYCVSDCYTVDPTGTNPYVLNTDLMQDVEGGSLSEPGNLQSENITDFFSGFDFEAFVVDQVTNNLPTDNKSISDTLTLENIEEVIRENMGVATYKKNCKVRKWPSEAYVNITNDSCYDFDENLTFRTGAVYDGDLIINEEVWFNDYDNEGLIVLGNLTINSDDSQQDWRGTVVVTGNLTFTGNQKLFDESMFIVLGKTEFYMDDYEGVETHNDNRAFTILSQDSIFITSINETNDNTDFDYFVGFFYTEESIWIDTVNSKLIMKGSLYARATGNTNYPLFMEDELENQVHGIVVNSYRGYTYASYNWWWGQWFVNHVPSNQVDNNRFQIQAVQENKMTKSFFNIPDLDNVTVSDGPVTIYTSEWFYE